MEQGRLKILVVDDEKDCREFLRRLFERNEFEVDLAMDGEDAIRKAQGRDFDVILMDATMPVMGGITATRIIKKDPRMCTTPVLMFTAHDERAMKEEAVKAGIEDFVSKTAEPEEIVRRARGVAMMKDYVSLRARYQKEIEEELSSKTAMLQGLLDEKEILNREILVRIAIAAEYRDDETGRHAERVGIISAVVAEAMGFDREFCTNLKLTAPLHDVGKIGIPDSILLKPGKLDPGEWSIMKTHTTIGSRILGGSKVPMLATAETIALHHHERWDGRGYPGSLAEEKIPVVGRIVTVADTFDAITSKRPYKEPMPYQKALDILVEERGKQLDPGVVDTFVKMFDRIMALFAKINSAVRKG